MTSHQLAHFLLEQPDAPIATVDDTGYHEAGTCYPLYLYRRLINGDFCGDLDVPVVKSQKSEAFLTIVVT